MYHLSRRGGTGRPGVLQSMGLQRVRHNWANEQQKQQSCNSGKRNSPLCSVEGPADTPFVNFIRNAGFPGDSVVKNLFAKAGDARDMGLIPESGRSPGGGNGNTLQYSCLENTMDRRAWWATVHGVAKELDRT